MECLLCTFSPALRFGESDNKSSEVAEPPRSPLPPLQARPSSYLSLKVPSQITFNTASCLLRNTWHIGRGVVGDRRRGWFVLGSGLGPLALGSLPILPVCILDPCRVLAAAVVSESPTGLSRVRVCLCVGSCRFRVGFPSAPDSAALLASRW